MVVDEGAGGLVVVVVEAVVLGLLLKVVGVVVTSAVLVVVPFEMGVGVAFVEVVVVEPEFLIFSSGSSRSWRRRLSRDSFFNIKNGFFSLFFSCT